MSEIEASGRRGWARAIHGVTFFGAAALGATLASCSSSDHVSGHSQGDAATGGAGNGGTAGSGGASGGPSGSGGASGGTGGSGGASGGPSGSGGASGGSDAGRPPPDPCVMAGNCAPGTWVDVTPPEANITTDLPCGNYGTETMQADAARPSDLYTLFMCQGIWKSTDYGQTWNGPINTGTDGAVMGDCAGGITMAPHATATPPTIYAACIRGNGIGFWRSLNGGLDWTRYSVSAGGARQDYYPPVVDPYDDKHLLMAGHEMNVLAESTDGGQTWTSVTLDAGMNQNGGTAGIFFIDTGDAATTRKTFLWLAQQSDQYGTWRTEDDGVSWQFVDKNEHPHGNSQIFQPDTSGVVYMAGAYSKLGWGVVRSPDYGKTWVHVGGTGGEAVVFGTKDYVYAMASGAVGLGGTIDPSLEVAPAPGTGTWAMPGTPPGMKIGAAQAAVTNDGSHDVIVTANWSAGLYRYVEP